MPLHPSLIFLAGLVVIIVGAEVLLRGASRIAVMLRIAPIIIGLTVVSVGTSTPELAVGITAALEGKGALAIGNIAGTNTLNILFILGLSALIRPLPIRLLSLRFDVPAMILSAMVLMVLSWDGALDRLDGLVLLIGAVGYTAALVFVSRAESAAARHEFTEEFSEGALAVQRGLAPAAWNGALLLAGMALTVLGAELLVSGATDIAAAYGVSDAIIGLTIVAIGTSAPELATTVVATIRNDRDVAIGNLIGSSIYNILIILGLTCTVAPGGIDISREIYWIDLPLTLAVAVACWFVFRSDRLVSRREGGLFVGTYLLYLASLLFLRI